MFGSISRTITFLARTPLIPPPPGPAVVEMATFSSGPSRPRAASRTISSMSVRSWQGNYAMESRRGMASDHGKKELYSDEGGSVGAGTDDVAHTDAAFDKNADPHSSAKKIEQESGKDYTSKSPANEDYSKPQGKQGEHEQKPLNTSAKR